MKHEADQPADDRPVETNILQVAPDIDLQLVDNGLRVPLPYRLRHQPRNVLAMPRRKLHQQSAQPHIQRLAHMLLAQQSGAHICQRVLHPRPQASVGTRAVASERRLELNPASFDGARNRRMLRRILQPRPDPRLQLRIAP